MQRFGVSRPSAVRSVAELKRRGLVATRKGAGTFVSQRNRTIGLAIPGTADSEFFSAIAAGWLVKTLKKLGVSVPGDVMVAGFDDVRMAARMRPPLTSVRQPCFEIANIAFKTLL